MDTEVEDMFAILSFLKLCKSYRKLKRKRQETRTIAAAPTQIVNRKHHQTTNAAIKLANDFQKEKEHDEKIQQTQPPIIEINHEEYKTYSTDPQEEQEQFNEILGETERLSDEEDGEFLQDGQLVYEEKPQVVADPYVEDEEEYQYAIAFEVNGEQRHVVLGGAVETDNAEQEQETKYECQEIHDDGDEIYYDVCPPDGQEHEVLLESVEEFNDDLCQDDVEICYEVNAEEIEEFPPDNTLLKREPEKRQRRRRRRGQTDDNDEDQTVKEKRPRTRLFKVRPENLNRYQEGFFGRVFLEVKKHNEEQFLILTRMKKDLFEKLLKLTFKAMRKRAQHVFPEERLSITLL